MLSFGVMGELVNINYDVTRVANMVLFFFDWTFVLNFSGDDCEATESLLWLLINATHVQSFELNFIEKTIALIQRLSEIQLITSVRHKRAAYGSHFKVFMIRLLKFQEPMGIIFLTID